MNNIDSDGDDKCVYIYIYGGCIIVIVVTCLIFGEFEEGYIGV